MATTKAAVKTLYSKAIYRREMLEASEGVDLTDGRWLVRIPKAEWPSDLDSRTAGKPSHDSKGEWDTEIAAPKFEDVLPLPWGANGDKSKPLSPCQFNGHTIGELMVGDSWNPTPCVPLQGTFGVAYFRRDYMDLLAAAICIWDISLTLPRKQTEIYVGPIKLSGSVVLL